MLDTALTTSKPAFCITRRHADKLDATLPMLTDRIVVAECWTLESWRLDTFRLEKDTTAVVLVLRVVPSGPFTVYDRLNGNMLIRSYHYQYKHCRCIWCLVQIVMNSLYLVATSWNSGRSPKGLHASCNILDESKTLWILAPKFQLIATERCWSMWGTVCLAYRSALGMERAKKKVTICTNNRTNQRMRFFLCLLYFLRMKYIKIHMHSTWQMVVKKWFLGRFSMFFISVFNFLLELFFFPLSS